MRAWIPGAATEFFPESEVYIKSILWLGSISELAHYEGIDFSHSCSS